MTTITVSKDFIKTLNLEEIIEMFDKYNNIQSLNINISTLDIPTNYNYDLKLDGKNKIDNSIQIINLGIFKQTLILDSVNVKIIINYKNINSLKQIKSINSKISIDIFLDDIFLDNEAEDLIKIYNYTLPDFKNLEIDTLTFINKSLTPKKLNLILINNVIINTIKLENINLISVEVNVHTHYLIKNIHSSNNEKFSVKFLIGQF